jgi:hypothetical protein
VDSSLNLLNSPVRRLEKHTFRASSLSMGRISIFFLPVLVLFARRDAIAAYP